MSDNQKQQIGFTAASIVLVLAVIVFCILKVRLITVGEIAFQEGTCLFSRHFHLYCPGCGGTRSIARLLKFDLIGSITANPIPAYSIAICLHVWIALFHNVVTKNKKNWRIIYNWEIIGILVVIAGNFILRNLLLVLFKIDLLGDMAGYW